MTGSVATVLALALLLHGCGDNSKVCGEGTDDIDGTCVAACDMGSRIDGTGECVPDVLVCANGTILDPATGQCVIDPASCQAGTVLIGGQCVDPTADDIVDLQEGAEPNGLGVSGEASLEPAGVIVLPAAGPYVVHGTIVPADHDDDGFKDNDIDAYLMTVAGPTLLAVSADGVHGLAAGFVALAEVDPTDPLATFRRLGLNVTGDTSQRQLFLPSAGTYILAIADTRTLILDGSSPGTGAVVGAAPGLAAFEYFVSIEPLVIPAPTAMLVTGTVATSPAADTISGDVKFFTVPMGAGFNRVTLGIATKQALASFVVLANDELRTLANGRRNGATVLPADAFVGGFRPADTCVIVVDPIMNHAVEPISYGLVVNLAAAVALPANGVVSAPEITANPTSFEQLTGFYLDIATADQIVGIALSFSQPVDIVLVDGARRVVSTFTYHPTLGAVRDTMTSYRGLLRFPAAGRYYFMAYEPTGSGATMITATSRITPLPATAITAGVPLVNRPIDSAFLSAPFSYAGDPQIDPWLTFDVVGANTGVNTVSFYDPSNAYGRLDTLTIQTPTSVVLDPDPTPIFEHAYPQAGGAIGRILLDDGVVDYLVRVHPASATPTAKTVTLDFRPRVFHDFMTVAAGQSAMATAETLSSAAPEDLYLVRTPAGNRVTITVDPTGAPPTNLQNLRFDLLDRDETSVRTVNATAVNASDVVQLVQAGFGWTAFAVTSSQPLLVTENYDVLVDVLAP